MGKIARFGVDNPELQQLTNGKPRGGPEGRGEGTVKEQVGWRAGSVIKTHLAALAKNQYLVPSTHSGVQTQPQENPIQCSLLVSSDTACTCADTCRI